MNEDLAVYGDLLGEVKTAIRRAQGRAARAVNTELLRLYWEIGRLIAERQDREGWGSGVIPRLARDLKNELPEVKGFSERNIKRMVQFAGEYPSLFEIGPPPVAQLPNAEEKGLTKGPTPLAQMPTTENPEDIPVWADPRKHGGRW